MPIKCIVTVLDQDSEWSTVFETHFKCHSGARQASDPWRVVVLREYA